MQLFVCACRAHSRGVICIGVGGTGGNHAGVNGDNNKGSYFRERSLLWGGCGSGRLRRQARGAGRCEGSGVIGGERGVGRVTCAHLG